tara:strand:- start:442 stop:573 length:132 start_codon:yes stop_codon:yes gene_type:complete
MDIEKEFQDLKKLIQDVYELMDRQKLDDALAKLEKIRVDVVGK